MNYNVTLCALCNNLMTFQQVREAVYWLPDLNKSEWAWALYEGFEHRFAHRFCWKGLKEKRRINIRNCAFKGQEPRSMNQLM